MNGLKYLIITLLILFVNYSCELDNYKEPNATLQGAIIDKETKMLIQQDLINGTKIMYEELGYKNPEIQNMIIKTDGTYQNRLMFTAKYNIYFNESNFVIPDQIKSYEVKKGANTLNFEVQPFIRVSSFEIEKVDNRLIAQFTVVSTVDTPVRTIALFAHIDYAVGDGLKLVEKKQDINAQVPAPVTYTLEIDLNSPEGQLLKQGETYHFRAGAIIDQGNARYNYAPAIRLTI